MRPSLRQQAHGGGARGGRACGEAAAVSRPPQQPLTHLAGGTAAAAVMAMAQQPACQRATSIPRARQQQQQQPLRPSLATPPTRQVAAAAAGGEPAAAAAASRCGGASSSSAAECHVGGDAAARAVHRTRPTRARDQRLGLGLAMTALQCVAPWHHGTIQARGMMQARTWYMRVEHVGCSPAVVMGNVAGGKPGAGAEYGQPARWGLAWTHGGACLIVGWHMVGGRALGVSRVASQARVQCMASRAHSYAIMQRQRDAHNLGPRQARSYAMGQRQRHRFDPGLKAGTWVTV
eukprot:355319-Chlamydomonas_euryale.AAC.5